MLEMAESLKSWVRITPGRGKAPLSGVFASHFVDEAIKVMEESDKDNSEDIISIRVGGGGSITP
jgi:hypothetical protein